MYVGAHKYFLYEILQLTERGGLLSIIIYTTI
jgi:hypothetical protein